MAILPRCLCVILTVWMVCSRPSTATRHEAPAFEAWWGTPESRKIAQQADYARRRGDLKSAESYYTIGYQDAIRRHDERAIVGYLNGIAACRITASHYRAALETLLEAKRHAQSIGDREALGAIAVNLSSVYLQVWDFESALREAEEGRATVISLDHPYCLPNLLIQLGRSHELQSDGAAASIYREGIAAARESGDKPLQALGLDLLGSYLLGEERLMHRGHLDEAAAAIDDGLDLRTKYSPSDLGFSWGSKGELERLRGNLPEAARYTKLALGAKRKIPDYLLQHQCGEIREALGDRAGALADFKKAVDLSSTWRLEVLPASSSLTAANEELEQNVFDSFIEAAAREAMRTGNRRWAVEAFEALELNRAASLRESLALSESWHRKVPPDYWETLSKLRAADARALGTVSANKESSRLLLKLAEMEAEAGLSFPTKNPEIFRDQTSLIHFQLGLGESEVLLSFHLGVRDSFLWAITRHSLHLMKLEAAGAMRTQVLALEDAVRAGRPEAAEWGERLYQALFGQLRREEAAKPSWLLSLDGALFEMPFAALVTERKGGKVSYLVSGHSVQTIPGALLLSRRPDAGTGWFLGVGDPIYNVADPRWKGRRKLSFFQSLTAGPAESGEQLGRLVGSARELETSAASWSRPDMLLEGSMARRDVFLSQLARGPAIVHLATHVLSHGAQAFIAFGLGSFGETEFLTTTDVASLRVPGAFVAMTGCDEAAGRARAGAGLLGLTRAWQMAGASAVLSTLWPVQDSTGDIFASFYSHLRSASPAEALRLSQMDMIRSGTWRSAPSYWAPYQITGGAR